MKISRKNKAQFIIDAKTIIENAKNDEYIKERILTIGYDDARIEEGLNLQKVAESTNETQDQVFNKKLSLNVEMKNVFKDAFKIYIGYVRLFRSSFKKDLNLKEKLGLYGKRQRTIKGFINQSRIFYSTILKESDILSAVEKFNLNREKIQSELQLIDKVEKAYMDYEAAATKSQRATEVRDDAFEKLYNWIRVFQEACKIVLRDAPQLLEKVGILVRSSRPAKKRTTDNPNVTADNTNNTGTDSESTIFSN
ncbi:MAG: hypothetical protein JSV88_20725 [Candidatus Aminicenantes bacterium]|nr:MAG: hypothetical protein JSV88_20725 [Candidatus Aminicenantes bacterium]